MKKVLALCAVMTACALPGYAATHYNGDKIDGVAVIQRLEVSDLTAGTTTKLWFRVSDQATGQSWYVPVIVIKGEKPGPKLLLTAGIHGDELNGIAVTHDIAGRLDPKTLSGTVTIVAGINTPGLLHSTRQFTPDGIATGASNLNRLMPGDISGDAANIFAARLWSQIFIGNTDIAVDLHTQSRGTAYPMYVFAETAGARRLADMIAPDVINMDPGIAGTVENTLNDYGKAAITLELGAPESFDPAMISRAITGIYNVMKDHGMITGKPDLSGPSPFVGNALHEVNSPRGGYVRLQVKLGDKVKSGDVLGTITNGFGEIVATVTAPGNGQILSLPTDPRLNPGDMVARLIYWDDKGICARTACPPKPIKK